MNAKPQSKRRRAKPRQVRVLPHYANGITDFIFRKISVERIIPVILVPVNIVFKVYDVFDTVSRFPIGNYRIGRNPVAVFFVFNSSQK